MGIITKVLGFKLAQKAANRLNAKREAVEARSRYIPAAAAGATTAKGRLLGNPFAQRAAQVYQRNPKLIATIGTIVLAAAAAAVARKRGMI